MDKFRRITYDQYGVSNCSNARGAIDSEVPLSLRGLTGKGCTHSTGLVYSLSPCPMTFGTRDLHGYLQWIIDSTPEY